MDGFLQQQTERPAWMAVWSKALPLTACCLSPLHENQYGMQENLHLLGVRQTMKYKFIHAFLFQMLFEKCVRIIFKIIC